MNQTGEPFFMLLPKQIHRRAGLILLIIGAFFYGLSSANAAYRTWTDKNGNTIHAELINTFGGKIVLQDKNGKIYKLDPAKLSEADQLYLNPPPPRYKIDLMKRSMQRSPRNQSPDQKEITTDYEWNFTLKVKFLTDDPWPEGLGGAMVIIGEDPQGNMVVIDKADGPIEALDASNAQLEGKGCELSYTRDKDGKWIKGIKLKGWLILLLANDGAVLSKMGTYAFLIDNPETALTLEIGDRFNRKFERL